MIHANVLVAGYYLYMESSYTRGGEKADLVSPWTPAKGGGQCLKFYYTMYGKTTGSLAVKLELSNGNNWFIFYKKGNQGKEWKKGIGNIDVPLGVSYRVTFNQIYHFYSESSDSLKVSFPRPKQ